LGNISEDKKEWFSEYCEMHQNQMMQNQSQNFLTQDTGTTNFPPLLPVAIKEEKEF